MGYFNWFHLFRAHRYSNEYLLCTISSDLSAKSIFLDHFWVKWPNFFHFFSQFNAKIGLKNDANWPKIYTKLFFLTLWAKPNRQPETDFNQYLGQYWVLLQTDSCVETVRSCRWFWVPWKLHSKQEKKDKIWLLLSKIVLKKWIWGKNWADGAKQVFIWESVSPKYVESVEISHLPANFFYFVMQCYHRNPPHHL